MLLTYSDLLQEGVMLFITFFGAVVLALLCGISFHEFSHAFTADRLGDHTARFRGRVSLNPARHLDPTGTVFMLIAGFGWGKPVPVNPNNLRNGPQTGRAMVAAAGPLSNILLAVLASLPMHLGLVDWRSPFLIPRSVSDWGAADYVGLLLSSLIIFNLVLAVFNFLPLAPLDGFAVAVGLLPRDLSVTVARWEQYGPGILMLLLVLPYFTGYSLLGDIMSPILNTLVRVIVGGGDVL
ncbi:MAG TPA: site-2 protease family protein [Dehalococcoidia bacterium]|nr:site-2 protease family protein [Dehalococcoidia bacterium]